MRGKRGRHGKHIGVVPCRDRIAPIRQQLKEVSLLFVLVKAAVDSAIIYVNEHGRLRGFDGSMDIIRF